MAKNPYIHDPFSFHLEEIYHVVDLRHQSNTKKELIVSSAQKGYKQKNLLQVV